MALEIRQREDRDRAEVERFLDERYSARVARLGRLEDSLSHPALVAEEDGRLAGVLTYILHGDSCEALTVHAAERLRGVGTALVEAVAEIAVSAGCSRLWLITTNDNLDALRFYQRRGFRLAELHAGAVDRARAELKPEIPLTGSFGIHLRDEIVLERLLGR